MERKKRNNQKNKGITLIALVITIVLLLILAGITINSIRGENGLINKTKTAKENSIKAQIKEEIELAIMEIQIEKSVNANNVTLEILNEELPNKLDTIVEIDNDTLVGEYKGYNYEVDSNFNIIVEDEINGIRVDYKLEPEGYTNENIILTIMATVSNGEITDIQAPDKLIKNQDGTYTVTENGDYEFTVTDSTGESVTKKISIGKIDKIAPKSIEIQINEEVIAKTQIPIKVEAIDEETGIARYEYYIKSKEETEFTKYESTENNYTVSELQPDTEYIIYVIAYDKANNSKESNTITYTTKGSILDYAILTSDGIMNCIDDNGNYYLDTTVNPKASDALKIGAYDDSQETYDNIEKETKRLYISKNLYGEEIALKIETTYGRNENSTSIYFYKENGEKIEGVGDYFYQEGGITRNGIYRYRIPQDCAYIEFWTGDGTYGQYIYVYDIVLSYSPNIEIIEQQAYIYENKIQSGYCSVILSPTKYIEKIMYKIGDGVWQIYNEPLKITKETMIYFKGISKEGKEGIENSFTIILETAIGQEAFDGDLETYIDISEGNTKKIITDSSIWGKKININLSTKYGRDENSTSIYFYKENGEKIEGVGDYFYQAGGTTTTRIYTYTIPQDCSYIEFWAGDGSYNPYIKIYEISLD